MSNEDRFPTELLAQPKLDRWQYFYDKIVAHHRLVEVDQELKQAIRYATKGRLILVFGPTGVGKSTLRRGIERALVEEWELALQEDREQIPLASVEAVAPEKGNFDWLDFYQRALESLAEPLIDHKVVYEAGQDGVDGQVVCQTKPNLRSLRQAMEKCFRRRRPVALIVDDAHHLQKIAGGRSLQDQMDAIKSLANRCDTAHVLLGTYELLNLANLNDQLSYRSYHIPFPRYLPHCAQDVRAFKTVLQTFQQHLPLPEEPDLVPRWDYFYEYSAGCIGILKLWLCDSLAAALEAGQKSLTNRTLQRYAIPPDRLLNIVREIVEGERKLAEMEEKRRQIRAALGLAPAENPTPPAQPAAKKGRVGQRKPDRRDPIGEQTNEA